MTTLAYNPSIDRIGEKFSFGADGCWPWHAGLDGHGYGKFWLNGKMRQAYKVMYELLVGPVPSGTELDHTCRNRVCVNPGHLEPVTHRENVRRGTRGPSRKGMRLTHCRRNHEFSKDNVYERPNGDRVCRTCRKASAQRRRAAC